MKTYGIEFVRTPAYSSMEFAEELAYVKAETGSKALEKFISKMTIRGFCFAPPNEHWHKLERILSVEEYKDNSLWDTKDPDFDYFNALEENTFGGLIS